MMVLLMTAIPTLPASSTQKRRMCCSEHAATGTGCVPVTRPTRSPSCATPEGPNWHDDFCAQGFSCSECAPEHYRDDDTLCKKCNDYVWIVYTLGIVAALVLAPLVMNVSKSHGFMSINIFIGTMQVLLPYLHPCI